MIPNDKIWINKEEMTSYTQNYHENMHNARATTGSVNKWSNPRLLGSGLTSHFEDLKITIGSDLFFVNGDTSKQ